MKIYEKLIKDKKNGQKLDIQKLNKEDFYFMYVIEGKTENDIAKLYGVTENKIDKLRQNWNIKVTQEFISDPKTMDKIYNLFGTGYKFDYSSIILKENLGIPKFNDLFFPVLSILKDEEVHNIQEFWRLTNELEYEISQKELEYCVSEDEPTLFYRADWCLNALLRARLIEDVEIKEYKITDAGQAFIKYCIENNIKKVQLGLLEEKIDIKTQAQNLKEIKYEPPKKSIKKGSKKKVTKQVSKTDFNKLNEIKIEFGKKCEQLVYDYEKNRLKQEGRKNVEEDVIWVSRDIGDGEGYDIKSKEKINGIYQDIYIEVKGTDKNCNEPFDISINEVEKSKELKDRYYIYRVGKANTGKPEFYKIKGSVRDNFKLEAVKFKATIKGEEDEEI